MTESLRDEQLATDDNKPFVEIRNPPAYDPEADAYAVDESLNPYRVLTASVEAGATFQLSLACADGRREMLELDRTESQAWLRGTLDERRDFANHKIREKRASIALAAARRLYGRTSIAEADLTPIEEAALREFDLLEDVREPIADGGYSQRHRIRESHYRAVKLREDGFWDGTFDDALGYAYNAPSQREYLPRGGPMGQQQLISDVWDSQAKCYWAWTHDPVARFGCELVADFILGRGVSVIANDEKVQTVLDEFIARELIPQSSAKKPMPTLRGRVSNRLHDMTVSIIRDGELFCRKMSMGDGRIKVRELPAETIWEIVTDAEDPLDVFYYVQRYQTRVVMFAPPTLPEAQTRWVERTIPTAEMLHVVTNAKGSDARGRSHMFPGLGWMKRLRDYFDAIIQKEYAAAAYQWHYKIKGGVNDLTRIASQVIPQSRPVPGSYFMTNDGVDVAAVASAVRAVAGNDSTYEALLNHIALAFGFSKTYFGANQQGQARANALVAVEPTTKHLETIQDLVAAFLTQLCHDVIAEAMTFALIPADTDLGFKCMLPSIIKADAAARGLLIRQGEGMGYFSKRTAAEAYAGEAEIDDYDFDDEMTAIKTELGDDQDPLKLIMKDVEMVKKGAPEETDVAFPPGSVADPDFSGAPAPSANGRSNGHSNGAVPAKPAGDAGNHSPSSGSGAAKIRSELGRGGTEDASTIESDAAFQEAARKRGAIVIVP